MTLITLITSGANLTHTMVPLCTTTFSMDWFALSVDPYGRNCNART